jgi:hypothetical protein
VRPLQNKALKRMAAEPAGRLSLNCVRVQEPQRSEILSERLTFTLPLGACEGGVLRRADWLRAVLGFARGERVTTLSWNSDRHLEA